MGDDKKKLLIAEDDKMISSMYKVKLEQEGFIILEAENGSQALEIAIKEKPDLIMLDVMMPQLDGFSVLQELKMNEGTKNIPIIMLTNLGTDEDKQKGEKMGATDYWVKANFTPAQIGEAIKKYLEK
jgi:DNA-binding response OmpR family regulator